MRVNFYGASSRVLSLIMASLASVLILLMPHAFTSVDKTVNHGLLMTLMLGTMIGFIHCVGFKAQSTVVRTLLHPLLGWLLMLTGLISLYLTRGYPL